MRILAKNQRISLEKSRKRAKSWPKNDTLRILAKNRRKSGQNARKSAKFGQKVQKKAAHQLGDLDSFAAFVGPIFFILFYFFGGVEMNRVEVPRFPCLVILRRADKLLIVLFWARMPRRISLPGVIWSVRVLSNPLESRWSKTASGQIHHNINNNISARTK